MNRDKQKSQAKVSLYRDDFGGHSSLRGRQTLKKLGHDVRNVLEKLGISISINVNLNLMISHDFSNRYVVIGEGVNKFLITACPPVR